MLSEWTIKYYTTKLELVKEVLHVTVVSSIEWKTGGNITLMVHDVDELRFPKAGKSEKAWILMNLPDGIWIDEKKGPCFFVLVRLVQSTW